MSQQRRYSPLSFVTFSCQTRTNVAINHAMQHAEDKRRAAFVFTHIYSPACIRRKVRRRGADENWQAAAALDAGWRNDNRWRESVTRVCVPAATDILDYSASRGRRLKTAQRASIASDRFRLRGKWQTSIAGAFHHRTNEAASHRHGSVGSVCIPQWRKRALFRMLWNIKSLVDGCGVRKRMWESWWREQRGRRSRYLALGKFQLVTEVGLCADACNEKKKSYKKNENRQKKTKVAH